MGISKSLELMQQKQARSADLQDDDFLSVPIKKGDRFEQLPLEKLVPFQGAHPFKPYTEDRIQSLMEDIANAGLSQPVVVRSIGNDCFEILAGHNRVEAVRRLGMETVLCHIRNVSDDQAQLIMVGTNLAQRDKLLPSEKAFAYKYQMDVLKRQGKRTDLQTTELEDSETLCRVCTKLDSAQTMAQKEQDSRRQVFNYIRLTYIIPPLLDMVDADTISFTAGVNLSFLSPEEQAWLEAELANMTTPTVSIELSATLKELSVAGQLSADVMHDLLFPATEKKEVKQATASIHQSYGKYVKQVTKARPLTDAQSAELLEMLKVTTETYMNTLA